MKLFALLVSLCVSSLSLLADTAQERLKESADIFKELMATPDKGISQDLLAKANCVVVVPGVKKAALGIGGQFGRGFAVCRNSSGSGWGNPASVRMEGGSFGFQIGASSTDVVMLVMNQRGMDKLLQSKFTLGADASVAAGPVGRTAAADTDARLSAEILSWSRSKGLFAGVALKGATLRPDKDENRELYAKDITNSEILKGNGPAPVGGNPLSMALSAYSRREGDPISAEREANPKKR